MVFLERIFEQGKENYCFLGGKSKVFIMDVLSIDDSAVGEYVEWNACLFVWTKIAHTFSEIRQAFLCAIGYITCMA